MGIGSIAIMMPLKMKNEPKNLPSGDMGTRSPEKKRKKGLKKNQVNRETNKSQFRILPQPTVVNETTAHQKPCGMDKKSVSDPNENNSM